MQGLFLILPLHLFLQYSDALIFTPFHMEELLLKLQELQSAVNMGKDSL
jgi:hypothetical protein